MNNKLEQENNIRNFASNGNLEGIRDILNNPCPGFDINSPDQAGRSALFLALDRGIAAKNREIIDLLLANGALNANGPLLPPSKLPKLLTKNANVKNLELIFQSFMPELAGVIGRGLVLEIGSGDGYLKYLLSLVNTPRIKHFINCIVETEISSDIVAKNLNKGKSVINTGIADLATFFGKSCFSGVISMNVLDTFTFEELVKNLRTIAEVLKPGGIAIHIMSSAVHENLFSELENRFPDRLVLPYYHEGNVGVRILQKDDPWLIQNQITPLPALYWSQLFAQNPDKYVELANIISQNYTGPGNQQLQNIFLFKDYSAKKIKNAFKEAGYQFLKLEETTSAVTVVKEKHHLEIPETNYFHNILGSLIVDNYPPECINPGTVMEKSTFLWIMAKRV